MMSAKISKLLFSGLASVVMLFSPLLASTALAYSNNNLIDDGVFNNSGSMSATQIDTWLNSSFGSTSCISTSHGFSASEPIGYNPSQGFLYGSPVSAGKIIYDAAQVYGLNPQVILATLQKEQSLVSGNAGCSVYGDSAAMGYGCPDGGSTYNYTYTNGSDPGTLPTPLFYLNGTPINGVNGTCVNSATKTGFSEQIIHGTWLLKFGQQRSLGNTSWDVQLSNFPNSGNVWNNSDDPQTCYGGPMTQGNFKRCSSDANTVYYDGYVTIDGTSVHLDNGATAALYWYTPHLHGNQNFDAIFTGWFGDPTTPCEGTGNLAATSSGFRLVPYQLGGTKMAFIVLNNTVTTCVENHVWNPGFTSWAAHYATGMRASDPSSGMMVPSRSRVDNQESLNFIVYSGASGKVESHRMSPNLQKFPGYYDVATNLAGVNPTTGTFLSGDFFGAGYDQLVYILYSGNNGAMEVHMFDPTMTRAVGFYDLPTDIGAVSNGVFVAGDFLGRGYAQLAYVSYGNTEVHLLDIRGGSAKRIYEVPTNLTGTSSSTGTFVAGDFLGRGYAQLVYVIYKNGVNRVETHMFDPSLTRATGFQDIITNLAGFDPSQ